MAAGAHEQTRANFAIDDPPLARGLDALDVEVLSNSRARTTQQVLVELTATNAVAHHFAAIQQDFVLSQRTSSEAGDRLHSSGASVILHVQLEFSDNLRCNPAAAKLV